MKYRTTRKAVIEGSARIVSANYCELQHLLQNHKPVAYTSGTYGWNFDVYEVNGLTICTGYRGMPGKPANNARKYDDIARALWNTNGSYESRAAAVEKALEEFCEQA